MSIPVLGFEFGVGIPNLSDLEVVPAIDHVPHWLDVRQEALPSEKYLFFVHASHPYFFLLNGLSRPLSAQVRGDVQAGRAKVLFFQPFEGGRADFVVKDYRAIEEWCDRSKIDPQCVHLIHGNLLAHPTTFHLHCVQNFELWNPPDITGAPAYTGEKIFLNYNRVPRQHRLEFVALLRTYGLLQHGHVSFNTAGHVLHPHSMHDATIQPHIEHLRANQLLLDTNSKDNLAAGIIDSHYADTLLSVVSETLVHSGTLFITEKTWKPIVRAHPFMILGNPGTLTYLKSLGFQTYDRWLDESYDEDRPIIDRMHVILSELKRISTLSVEARLALAVEMSETALFNQQQMKTHVAKKYDTPWVYNKPVHDIVNEIWESF